MKPILIGLHGPTGVGKDTVAQIMRENHGARRLAFGDPLKRAVNAAFGLGDEWLLDEFKTKVHPHWGITRREMDQRTGTEAMRGEFGADFWVRRLELDYYAMRAADFTGPIVITDVRYNGEETESTWVRAQGGCVVHMEGPQRRGDVNHSHISNTKLPVLAGDYILPNTGDLETLEANVMMLMSNIYSRARETVNA
jgi:hypothetical protein